MGEKKVNNIKKLNVPIEQEHFIGIEEKHPVACSVDCVYHVNNQPIYHSRHNDTPIQPPSLHKMTQLAESAFLADTVSLVACCFFGVIGLVLINVCRQFLLRRKTEPPAVLHWLPYIGNAVSYGMDPVGFFNKCRAKVCLSTESRFTLLIPEPCSAN